MNVIDATKLLIGERVARKESPEHATLLEVKNKCQLPDNEFRKQVSELVKTGKIRIGLTLNSFAFFSCR